MSKIEDCGPAFPIPAVYDQSRDQVNPASAYGSSAGMSLRDYLAAKAMQALLSTCDVSKNGYNYELSRRAVQSYLVADAMLLARKDLG